MSLWSRPRAAALLVGAMSLALAACGGSSPAHADAAPTSGDGGPTPYGPPGSDADDTRTADAAPSNGEGGAPTIVNELPCLDPKPFLSGKDTGFELCASGALHRAAARACPARVPTTCMTHEPDAAVECANDSDCQRTPGGACTYAPPVHDQGSRQLERCYCSAGTSGCGSDADCRADQLCLCGDNTRGRCVKARCRSDADCRPGFLCTSSHTDRCSDRDVFSCQRPTDVCGGDGDCPTPSWPGNACVSFESPTLGSARLCQPRMCSP